MTEKQLTPNEIAIEIRKKIAKAIFADKVSSYDIESIEHKILAEAIQSERLHYEAVIVELREALIYLSNERINPLGQTVEEIVSETARDKTLKVLSDLTVIFAHERVRRLVEAVRELRKSDGSNGTYDAGKCLESGKEVDEILREVGGV